MRKQQQQQEQQQSPLHRKKNVPIDLHQGSTSFSFPRPISNAWQNPFVRASSTSRPRCPLITRELQALK